MSHGWPCIQVSLRVAVVLALVIGAAQWSIAQSDATPPIPEANGEAQPDGETQPDEEKSVKDQMLDLVRMGGVVGGVIFALSLTMVYLIVEHLLNIRRGALIPATLAESIHQKIGERDFNGAIQQCKGQPCFLANVLASGLSVIELGYHDAEKSMEDTATEQSARLTRRTEYLHLIGTLAPMLGLLGTVWGMIQAFMEFESKANPAVSELAPGIYRALVTTMMGLTVAVPAFASFAIFRNRIDELVAEASLTAEHVFADFRRDQAKRQRSKTKSEKTTRESVPSVTIQREKNS
jgi:biopolymer transport protein ExbB